MILCKLTSPNVYFLPGVSHFVFLLSSSQPKNLWETSPMTPWPLPTRNLLTFAVHQLTQRVTEQELPTTYLPLNEEMKLVITCGRNTEVFYSSLIPCPVSCWHRRRQFPRVSPQVVWWRCRVCHGRVVVSLMSLLRDFRDSRQRLVNCKRTRNAQLSGRSCTLCFSVSSCDVPPFRFNNLIGNRFI